ncbi:MAG: hypothetical protein U1F56_06710 [Rubrivivax sp.]
MTAPAPSLLKLLRPTLTRGVLLGCTGYLATTVALAWLLWRRLPGGPAELKLARAGLALFAAGCLVAALVSLWAMVQRVLKPGQAMAGSGVGRRVVRRGRVVADGPLLQAPLSGTPCVAYIYKLFRVRRAGTDTYVDVFYAGAAGVAFRLEGDPVATPVHALPGLMDDAQPLQGAQALARARALVAHTPFTEREGLATGLTVAAELISNATQRLLQPGRIYRRDWVDPGAGGIDLRSLQFDEKLLPVDAQACVVGNWSDAAQAIVPSTTVTEPALAAVSPGGLAAMQRVLGAADLDGAEPREGGPGGAVVAAAVMALFGALALALAHLL